MLTDDSPVTWALVATSGGAVVLTSSPPVNVTKASAAVGVATDAARADHKHDITTAAAGSVGAANAEGTATSLARSDHGHQVSDLAIAGQVQGDILYFNGTNWVRLPPGTAGNFLQTAGAAANPLWASPAGASGLVRQTIFKEILVDTTTTSSTFGTLLSQAITTAAGTKLRITFSSATSNTKPSVTYAFRVMIDGVVQRGAGASPGSAGATQSTVFDLLVSGLSAAAHTVEVQWRSDPGAANTTQCRPVTFQDTEHASLTLLEVVP